jgi:AraC family transcriptional regulator of adaptative response/methylated-DNA-[protein]-cysteine methyltransferase
VVKENGFNAPTLPSQREMLQAFEARDTSYDGIFFAAVRTTGVFCRPSCPARKPRRDNVEYFADAHGAIFAGYRPCKRCKPLETSGSPPDWAVALVTEIEHDPGRRIRDADLRDRGLEPARVRRAFQRHYGMTFQAYARGRRLGEAFHRIKAGEPLDDVIPDHGFESYSGFRDAFGRTFGLPPGASRDADCIVAAWIESPLGPLLAGATAQGVCLLEFTDRRMMEAQIDTVSRRIAAPVIPGTNRWIEALRLELGEYFGGQRRVFDVPLVAPGTPFQERVWSELRRIPYGTAVAYAELAARIGAPGASRAVGRANGTNRIAIVIPCHRVVQKDGTIGGYGGGVWRKARLLELEGVVLGATTAPRLAGVP